MSLTDLYNIKIIYFHFSTDIIRCFIIHLKIINV